MACPRPINRGRSCVPLPEAKVPTLTSGTPKRAECSSEANVAGAGQHESAAECQPVARCDHRQARVCQGETQPLLDGLRLEQPSRLPPKFADVRANTEGAAAPGEDEGACLGSCLQFRKARLQSAPDPVALHTQRLRDDADESDPSAWSRHLQGLGFQIRGSATWSARLNHGRPPTRHVLASSDLARVGW